MHAQDAGTTLRSKDGGREASGQALLNGLAGYGTQHRLAGNTGQHRQPVSGKHVKATQQFEVLLKRLAKTEPRIEHQTVVGDRQRLPWQPAG